MKELRERNQRRLERLVGQAIVNVHQGLTYAPNQNCLVLELGDGTRVSFTGSYDEDTVISLEDRCERCECLTGEG